MASDRFIVTVGYTDKTGGAARATLDFAKVASECRPGSFSVFATDLPSSLVGRANWVLWWAVRVLEHFFIRLLYPNRIVKQSLNTFSNRRIKALLNNQVGSPRFHLHWIANSTLSIRELGRLPVGTMITLHDEWLIAGTSHYSQTEGCPINDDRKSLFRPVATWLDRHIYERKKRAFSSRQDLTVTVPSAWMKRRVVASGVFSATNVTVIPNAVNTDKFFPAPERRFQAREKLGLTQQDFLVCFGADKSQRNPIKGTDLFIDLLTVMTLNPSRFRNVTFVVFGGLTVDPSITRNLRFLNLGPIQDREELADLYRASDLVLHLARLEAFGLVPCEAMSCGTPVICFDNSGAAELIADGITGYLCPAFDVEAVANKISSLVDETAAFRENTRAQARQRVVAEYSLQKLSERYGALLMKD
jgi:glycosyltransferase involved in cell wall biosynthesis